jgi:hypothetical protein
LVKIATSSNSNNACGKSCNQYSAQWIWGIILSKHNFWFYL